MSAFGAGKAESLAEKVKVCNTCGDAGFDDCLALCSLCNEGAEHGYCMVTVFDKVPPDWICEGCKVKQREISRRRGLVSNGLLPVQAQKKQVQSSSSLAKGIKLGHSSLHRKDSPENGTEQLVTMQADKAQSNGPACQVLSKGGATIKKKILVKRDLPCFISTVTQKLSSNISLGIVASDRSKPSHSVMPARNLSAKESSYSETEKAVFTSRYYNDTKENKCQDFPSVLPETFTKTISTSNVSNSQPAITVAQIVKEPSSLTEPVFVQEISAITLDTKTSGERIGSEEQGLNNTVVSSLGEGKPHFVEAESCNVNKTLAFSSSSLAEPVAIEKEEMKEFSGSGKQHTADHHSLKESKAFLLSSLAKPTATEKNVIEVISQIGKLVPTKRTISKHTISIAERNTSNTNAEAPTNTDILIRSPITYPQLSMMDSTCVKSESEAASSYTKNEVVPAYTTAPIWEAPLMERKNVNVNEDAQNRMNISAEKPTLNAQAATINSTSLKIKLKLEPAKGTAFSETGNVVSVCRNAGVHATPLSERTEEDTIIASDGPTAKPQHASFNSKSTKSESVVLVKRSRSHTRKVTIRDFPIITKKIRILGEGEKVSNLKSKGNHLNKSVASSGVEELLNPLNSGGNVLAREDRATGQEIDRFRNEEHQESGGLLVERTTTEQKTDSFCTSLKTKEKEIALGISVEPPSLFNMEEKAQPQEVKHKAGARGCLIKRPAECSSLYSEKEKIHPQNVQPKDGLAGSPPCLVIGSVESFCVEEETELQNVKEKGGVAGSLPYITKNSGLGTTGLGGTKAALHSVPSIERNDESLVVSPCSTKGPPSEVVPTQENSKNAASGTGLYKVPVLHSKRVAKRDFPPLKGQVGKVGMIVSPSCKPKVVSPSEDKKQVTGTKLDDTEKSIGRHVPAITQEALPEELKSAWSCISMGNHVGVMTPEEDERSSLLPVEGVFTKQSISNIKAASMSETKESAIFPLSSFHTRPEDKECHGNAKQGCDATGLAACVPREATTRGVSSTIGDELAMGIKTVPTNIEPALKRKTTKENLSGLLCKDGSLTKGVATLKSVKGPPLRGEMEGVTVKDTSSILLDKREDLRQKGEALQAVAASSCQARSSGDVSLAEDVVVGDGSNASTDKVTFTGKHISSVDVDYDLADRNFSDEAEFSSGRHTSRSQCAVNKSTCMMDDYEQPSFFEPKRRVSPRPNKGAVRPSSSSIRERHEDTTYLEREDEDDGFHARCEDAGCEPLDHQMGLRKSTLVRPRHHTLPDRNGEKKAHSRGCRHEGRESRHYKGAYWCHRCEGVGHSAEFCKADRQKEWKTPHTSDFDDRVSDSGHAKRECMGFQASDGRKRRRYDSIGEERFMNSRSRVDSGSIDCHGSFKRPSKPFEHTRYDEEHRYKSQLREEASFERETSRVETSRSLNGMQSELNSFLPSKPYSKPSEYTRVHKRQIVWVHTQDRCEGDTYFENGKLFIAQGNVSSCPAGPAEVSRSGHGSRLPPNQAPPTSQGQVCKDRIISRTHVPPQVHGSSIRKFSQERRAAPDPQVMWTGCFYVTSNTGWETCYQGFQARPSQLAHSKVFEALLDLPVKLKMEEKERGVETDSWPRVFQESPPTSHSIGIYFFPTDTESYSRWYKPLANRLAARDFALKVNLDFAQLLIFSSQILPEAEQFWDDRSFLWGIFRRNVEDSSHLSRKPSCRDPGSDLGSPAGNGEVIDMDVEMLGGEDAVSQQFNPPLPPGFAPALPCHP